MNEQFEKWYKEEYGKPFQYAFTASGDTIKLMLEDAFLAGAKAQHESRFMDWPPPYEDNPADHPADCLCDQHSVEELKKRTENKSAT